MTTTPAMHSSGRARRIIAVVLVAFAALLAPFTVLAVWVHDHILDTDGYVATVAPLADNPAITDPIAARIVDVIFEKADVQNRITGVLPGPVDALGKTFSHSLRNLATTQAERFLESDAFQSLWEQANRIADEQVVAMFTGNGAAVTNHNGEVVLDMGAVADKVRQRLVDQGVGILKRVEIPKGQAEIVLFQSDSLPKMQTLFRVLNDLATVLPIVMVILIIGAIATSVRRRRTVIELGFGVAATSLALVALLHFSRREYLHAAAKRDLNRAGAEAVFDTLVHTLQNWAWMVFVVALIVGVAALLTDPVRIEWVARRVRGGDPASATSTGIAPWVREHRLPLRLGGAAVALVTLAIWPSPTVLVVVLILVVLALYLGLVTAIGRLTKPTAESGGDGPGGSGAEPAGGSPDEEPASAP